MAVQKFSILQKDVSIEDISRLVPGESNVWAAKMQPLFKTYNGCFGHRVDDAGYDYHYIEGNSPLVYKPVKLTYVGMFTTLGADDKIVVLSESMHWLKGETYVVNFSGGWQDLHGKIVVSSDFLYAVADREAIIDGDKLALTEEKCLELCRYFNTGRSMRCLDHGLNLVKEGKHYRETLFSMLRQLDEAERAEYMVDPIEEIRKDMDRGV